MERGIGKGGREGCAYLVGDLDEVWKSTLSLPYSSIFRPPTSAPTATYRPPFSNARGSVTRSHFMLYNLERSTQYNSYDLENGSCSTEIDSGHVILLCCEQVFVGSYFLQAPLERFTLSVIIFKMASQLLRKP